MLLAEDSGSCTCSAASLSAALTMRWQSSKRPATRKALTLSPKQPSWCAWRGETNPSGYRATTRMPGWRWNAAATAAPVSPDVATRIVNGRASARGSRRRQAARKRAPKSLNAQVGPWNSSSIAVSGCAASGRNGASNVKASAQMAGSSPASASPAKNGASRVAAVSASVPCGSNAAGSIDGNASGTYRPPSGASPAAIASPIGTVGPALRVLW